MENRFQNIKAIQHGKEPETTDVDLWDRGRRMGRPRTD